MGTTRTWRQFDLILLLVAIALFLFGIGVIRSANLDTLDRADLWRTQARFGLIGFGIFLLMAAIPYEWLRHVWWVGYLIALGLLILVLFVGESDIGDVRRWFFIGDFRLQPSFPALLFLIVSVAAVFGKPSKKERRLDEIDQPWQDRPGLKQYILSGILALVLAVLVFREPDLSTAMVFLAVWMAMAFVSEVHWIYLVGTLVLAIAALIPLWSVMEPYQQERVLTFFDSSRNPDALYNVQQALISIGSGGVWGKGYGKGSLNRLHFLRVRHTDFIFSVVGEELGFIGATILILLFGLLAWRLFRAALLAPDLFGRLLVVGVGAILFFQAAVNIAMNLNLFPVAGLPLPFISYGGTSLVTFMSSLGLVEAVAMRHR